MEEWKTIPEFERYEVSNLGNVRRGGRLLKPGLDSYGYRQINLYKNNKRFCRKVYRLVLDTFIPNTDNKPQIDHINRIRTDDRLENLRWVTASENCRNKSNFSEDMLGISWNKKNSTYTIRLVINGKETYFGSKEILEDAIQLRDDALAGKVTFTPQRNREMYGISKVKNKPYYAIKINNKKVYYKHTIEEAKLFRDKHLNNSKDEGC